LKKKIYFIFVLFLSIVELQALTIGDQSLSIYLYNEGVALPFTQLIGEKVNPGFMIGTEFHYLNRKGFTLFQSLELGYYIHPSLQFGLRINTEIGGRYTFDFGLVTEVSAGIGYSHNFTDRDIYALNGSGEFSKVIDWGRPQFCPSFGIGLGSNFSKIIDIPMSLVVHYKGFFDILYSYSVPILPHFGFGISTRFSL
jgi:hypothetical protein